MVTTATAAAAATTTREYQKTQGGDTSSCLPVCQVKSSPLQHKKSKFRGSVYTLKGDENAYDVTGWVGCIFLR